MGDIINLSERKNAASKPDADCVVVEVENGQPVKYFKFIGEYDFEGNQFCLFIWAIDLGQAQRRFDALSGARCLGQVYSEIPA